MTTPRTERGIADDVFDSSPSRLERTSFAVGTPIFVAAILVIAGVWIVLNTMAPSFGWTPPDPAPFVWVQRLGSLVSLALLFILARAQRRYRERMDRKFAMLRWMAEGRDAPGLGVLRNKRSN